VGYFFFPYFNFSGIGKSGVFLFFILSSFLLTLPLLTLGKNIFSKQQISYYWSRRFFRIYPLYFLYLLLALLSSVLINNIFGPKTWAIPFQLSLVEFGQHIFLQSGKSVTWSIAVEFKYYFILPFIALLLSAVLHNNFVNCLSFLLFSITGLLLFQNQTWGSTDVLPYLPVFLFGALLAVVQYQLKTSAFRFNAHSYRHLFNVTAYICLLILIVMIPAVYSVLFKPVEYNFFAQSFLLYSCLWSIIIFSLVNSGRSLLSDFLSSRIPCFLGKISFSVYLIHPIFIDMMRHFKIITPFNAWIVLILTLITANFSYKLIELRVAKANIIFFNLKKASN